MLGKVAETTWTSGRNLANWTKNFESSSTPLWIHATACRNLSFFERSPGRAGSCLKKSWDQNHQVTIECQYFIHHGLSWLDTFDYQLIFYLDSQPVLLNHKNKESTMMASFVQFSYNFMMESLLSKVKPFGRRVPSSPRPLHALVPGIEASAKEAQQNHEIKFSSQTCHTHTCTVNIKTIKKYVYMSIYQ